MSKVKFTPHNLRRLFMFLVKAFIVVATSLMFLFILKNYLPKPFFRRGNYLGVFLYAFLFMIIGSPYDVFKIGIFSKRNLQLSYIITVSIVNIIAYFVLCLIARKMLNPGPILVLGLIQYAVGFLMYELAFSIYYDLYPSRDTVIIYADSEYDKDVARKFEMRKDRYNIKSVIRESAGVDKLKAEIDKYSTVIIGAIDLNLRNELLDYSYQLGKRIFILPSVNDVILHSSHVTQIGDSLMHLVKDRTMSLEQMIIKRVFDILFSLLFLTITSPILLIVAILIKAYDGGPVFYKQKRLTRNGEEFEIIKFRSMVVNAEKHGAQFTTDNDSRITPIGKFIRKTRIDEIPQFINVLKGEMSTVGPRAERVENYDIYTKLMPQFYYRTKVKAGITGYAQIYGRYNTSHEDKARMDIYYIENFSLLNDIKLILATVKVVFSPEATEGFSSSFFDEAEKKPAAQEQASSDNKPSTTDSSTDETAGNENEQELSTSTESNLNKPDSKNSSSK